MTVGEYVKLKLSQWSFDYYEELLSAEIYKAGIEESSEFNENTNTDKVFYNILPDILFVPKSVSEGGYSVSYNSEGMTAYYELVCKRLGLPNMLNKDTITDITHKW